MILNTDMDDFEKAKYLLKKNNCSCVICGGSDVIISFEQGIRPLVSLTESGTDFSGFSAADKIVGKAAALLYVLLDIKNVYGGVMSQQASEVFRNSGINFEYAVLTDEIVNRMNTGICPMEDAVRNTYDPSEALSLIKNKLKIIDKNKKIY